MTIADMTFKIPVNLNEEIPTLAKAAPKSPPINACEELDGRPKYQVKIFQKIAATSAEKIS